MQMEEQDWEWEEQWEPNKNVLGFAGGFVVRN